ncbi:hypothetical protein Tco_0009845 [Tanacetum coccineum]
MFQANHEDAYAQLDEGPMRSRFLPTCHPLVQPTIQSMRYTPMFNQIFDNVDYQLSQEMHQEEHLDSDAETEIDDNTIPYHQYLLDTEAQNVPTEVSADTSNKKPKKATNDLHKDILGTRNPGLGYMAKRAQPVLYDADTLLHPNHHPVSIWDSEDVLVHQVVSMKKMNEKPGHVRPKNGIIKERTTQKPDYVSEWCFDYAKQFVEQQLANTPQVTAYTEKLSAFTAENTKLKAQVTGKTSSGPSTSATPKVLAPGMYNLGSKYIPPPKRANWVKPTPVPKKKQVTFSEPPRPSLKPTQKPVVHPNKQTNVCVPMSTGVKPTSGASKTVPKRAPQNHSSLPAKNANARRVEAHHRTLNKKNRVDSNLLIKHSVSVSRMNNVCGACNKSLVFANHNDCLVMCDGSVNVKPHQTKRFKRQPKKEWKPIKKVWKQISKPVADSKPQWKPTGRHFSLFEKHPLTRIMESTDQPIELPPSATSSPKRTMVSRFTDHKLSDRQAGSKGISGLFDC